MQAGRTFKDRKSLGATGSIPKPGDLPDRTQQSPHPLNSANYDQPPYEGQRSLFIICSVQRSGSTLLGTLLSRSGDMGVPHEYFHWLRFAPVFCERFGSDFAEGDHATEPVIEQYIDALLRARTTPSGVFGLKCHFDQFNAILRSPAFLQAFQGMRNIWLRRRDILAQSVSFCMSVQTERWHSFQRNLARPRYNTKQIDKAIKIIQDCDNGWCQYFSINDIAPLELWYEDLANRPVEVARQVCDFVGQAQAAIPPVEDTGIKRMANDMNRDWMRRYRAEPHLAHMRGPDFEV